MREDVNVACHRYTAGHGLAQYGELLVHAWTDNQLGSIQKRFFPELTQFEFNVGTLGLQLMQSRRILAAVNHLESFLAAGQVACA